MIPLPVVTAPQNMQLITLIWQLLKITVTMLRFRHRRGRFNQRRMDFVKRMRTKSFYYILFHYYA